MNILTTYFEKNKQYLVILGVFLLLLFFASRCVKGCDSDNPTKLDQMTVLFIETAKLNIEDPKVRVLSQKETENLIRAMARRVTLNKSVIDSLDLNRLINDPSYAYSNPFDYK